MKARPTLAEIAPRPTARTAPSVGRPQHAVAYACHPESVRAMKAFARSRDDIIVTSGRDEAARFLRKIVAHS